ncbi:MAG TPA: hypothetical protein VK590_09480 [Saprospiraceae bacterium]|nr:hypothetical protein [Saprospiraceae bacterium]
MRRIIRKVDLLNRGKEIAEEFREEDIPVDSYIDKISKLVPAEIIAAFLAINNLIEVKKENFQLIHWICFFILLIITPFYIFKMTKSEFGILKSQIILSTISFVVWVFAIGGPFLYLNWYNKIYGSIALILFSVISPLLITNDKENI